MARCTQAAGGAGAIRVWGHSGRGPFGTCGLTGVATLSAHLWALRVYAVELQRPGATPVVKAIGAPVLPQKVRPIRIRTRSQLHFILGAVVVNVVLAAVAGAAEYRCGAVTRLDFCAAKLWATKRTVLRQISSTDVDIGALSDQLCACRRQPHARAEEHAEQQLGTTSRHACGRPAGADRRLCEHVRAPAPPARGCARYLEVRRYQLALPPRVAREKKTAPLLGPTSIQKRQLPPSFAFDEAENDDLSVAPPPPDA